MLKIIANNYDWNRNLCTVVENMLALRFTAIPHTQHAHIKKLESNSLRVNTYIGLDAGRGLFRALCVSFTGMDYTQQCYALRFTLSRSFKRSQQHQACVCALRRGAKRLKCTPSVVYFWLPGLSRQSAFVEWLR